MNVSSVRGSPDFRPDYPHYCVSLDGESLTTCVAASEAEGWVDVLATDERGNFYRHANGTAATVRRFGVVEIREAPKPPPAPPRPVRREIDSGEALELIAGITPDVTHTSGSLSDGDILLSWSLPDGRTVEYTAYIIDDYYGGEYTHIRWYEETPPPTELTA